MNAQLKSKQYLFSTVGYHTTFTDKDFKIVIFVRILAQQIHPVYPKLRLWRLGSASAAPYAVLDGLLPTWHQALCDWAEGWKSARPCELLGCFPIEPDLRTRGWLSWAIVSFSACFSHNLCCCYPIQLCAKQATELALDMVLIDCNRSSFKTITPVGKSTWEISQMQFKYLPQHYMQCSSKFRRQAVSFCTLKASLFLHWQQRCCWQ